MAPAPDNVEFKPCLITISQGVNNSPPDFMIESEGMRYNGFLTVWYKDSKEIDYKMRSYELRGFGAKLFLYL